MYRVKNSSMYLFFVLFALARSDNEVNCNDGNRGGCSHSCHRDVCTCPPCWTLDGSGLKLGLSCTFALFLRLLKMVIFTNFIHSVTIPL